MSINKLTTDLNIVQALPDRPNSNLGLTPNQLKAKFDEAGNIIQDYINDSLVTQLESTTAGSSGAKQIGVSTISGVTGANVQDAIANVKAQVDTKADNTATTNALALKADKASPTFTGTVTLPATTSIGTVDGTEIGYLDGVTSNVQTQINTKAPLASPALTGTPTAPTAAADTNTTQLATTAFVAGQASATSPAMDGTATVGTSLKYARADHVHPTDTTRASVTYVDTQDALKADKASPTFTGTVTLPSTTSIGTVSSTEIGYLDGVTSAVQTQIDGKLSKTGDTVSLASNGLTVGTNQLAVVNGNVGVGTSIPNSKLHVASGVASTVTPTVGSSVNSAAIFTNNQLAYGLNIVPSGDGKVHIQSQRFDGTATSYDMTFQSQGGNVGIGTSLPAQKLDVRDGYLRTTTGNGSSGTHGGRIIFGLSSGTSGNFDLGYVTSYTTSADGTGGYGGLIFATKGAVADTSPAERMRITDTGNVGIGTTSPAVKLEVKGGGGWSSSNYGKQLFVTSTYGTSNPAIAISDSVGGNLLAIGNNAGAFVFNSMPSLSDSTTAPIERMRINASGNVGIGTNSPNGRFEIGNLPTSISYGFIIGNGANSDNYYTSGSSGLHIFRQAGTERMRIDSSGNVLIGATATSGYFDGKLNVTGGMASFKNGGTPLFVWNTQTSGNRDLIYFMSGSTWTNVGTISTNGTSTSYNTTSDYRLKEDNQDFNALSILSNIKMYDYKWKDSGERSHGVFAHELQQVIPYAVTGEKDGEQMQGVDYSKLVPILTKAIQELYAEVQTLKAGA